MGKIIAWLVLIFIVLLALRLVNQRKARKQQRAAGGTAGGTAAEPMVRCTRCGVFLPRADAIRRTGEYACPDGQCVKR